MAQLRAKYKFKEQLTQRAFKSISTTFVRNDDVAGLKMPIFWNGDASVPTQTALLYSDTPTPLVLRRPV